MPSMPWPAGSESLRHSGKGRAALLPADSLAALSAEAYQADLCRSAGGMPAVGIPGEESEWSSAIGHPVVRRPRGSGALRSSRRPCGSPVCRPRTIPRGRSPCPLLYEPPTSGRLFFAIGTTFLLLWHRRLWWHLCGYLPEVLWSPQHHRFHRFREGAACLVDPA